MSFKEVVLIAVNLLLSFHVHSPVIRDFALTHIAGSLFPKMLGTWET